MKVSKDSISIPLTFNSKDIYIGKGTLKGDKSNYKFTSPKTPEKTITTSQKYNIKEFNIINKDKAKKDIFYKGRETPQDSCYILMKYNFEHHCMQLYKANKWINFIQTFNYRDKKIEDIEGKKKEEQKAKNKIIKDYFNFEHSGEMLKDKAERKNTRKKKDILANNKPGDNSEEDYGEDFSDDDRKKKKKSKYEYEEDSHSSEDDPNLADDSYEEEKRRRKEEEKLREEEKRLEMEKEKQKNEKEDNNESDFDFDDDSLNEQPSEIDDDNNDNFLDLLNKKRKREVNELEENIREELDNMLRKNNRMTYDEIVANLIKNFTEGQVHQYIDKILDENTKKYIEKDNNIYYFKK